MGIKHINNAHSDYKAKRVEPHQEKNTLLLKTVNKGEDRLGCPAQLLDNAIVSIG